MDVLRTPDERFADLPGYPFEPHYATIDDLDGGELRVHYLDEGDPAAAPVLLMHGEPSWSFLYRHMVEPLVAAGHRVVAPDLVGFGRSDKPAAPDDYSYARHVRWMEQLLVEQLDLRDVTFFGQDWGGLVGLRIVAAHPDRFARVVVGNTGLPTGHGKPSEAFLAWQQFAATAERFPVGGIINGGCATDLAPRGDRRLRRPVPGRLLQGGRPDLPDPGAHQPRRPRGAGQPGRLGGAVDSSRSRGCAPSATPTPSPRAASPPSSARSPAPPASRT